MRKEFFESNISKIIAAIRKAGYNPYDQLTGYVKTGIDSYITRTDGARDLIKQLDKEDIQAYLQDMRRS